jgi:hypothetical protein
MTPAWTAEDWRDHFNERAGIMEVDAGSIASRPRWTGRDACAGTTQPLQLAPLLDECCDTVG